MIRTERIVRKSLSGRAITWRVHYVTSKREGFCDFLNRNEATGFAVEILRELLDTENI